MANYYVDLERNGSGYAGTSLDPFSYLDYINVSSSRDDVFYLKGSNIISGEGRLEFKKGRHIGWNLSVNGPWRISGQIINNDFKSGFIKDCILAATVRVSLNVGPQSGEGCETLFVRNSIIYTSSLDLYLVQGGLLVFEGCVIIANGINGNYSSNSNRIIFRDCIFIKEGNWECFFVVGGGVNLLEVEFYNCACNCPLINGMDLGADAPFYITACQENWDAPQWPSWNGSKEEFGNPNLFTGITSPPQPGNPPYTGYETDLFGNPRISIGTGCFYLEEGEGGEEEGGEGEKNFLKKESNVWENYLRLHIVGENVHRDAKLGCPWGDIVDNSSGENKVKNINKGPVRTVTGSWLSIKGCSRPIIFYFK